MAFLKNLFLLFFLFIGTLTSCQPSEKSTVNHDNSYSEHSNDNDSTYRHKKKHKKRHRKNDYDRDESNYQQENNSPQTKINAGNVPQKALNVLKYVRDNDSAMDGYVGGRRFGNFENLLPKKDASGKRISYQEWDVNPKVNGKNRGTERLITGSDGKAYYTNDHYRSFVEVRN